MNNNLKTDESETTISAILGISKQRKTELNHLCKIAIESNSEKTVCLKTVVDQTRTLEEAVYVAFFTGSFFRIFEQY